MIPLSWFVMIEHLPYLYLFCLEEIKKKDHVLKFPVFCSLQNNYKIQATRLTHEIDDMRRRLENAKMKLTAEMKVCHLTSPYHQHSFPTPFSQNSCSYFPLLWH